MNLEARFVGGVWRKPPPSTKSVLTNKAEHSFQAAFGTQSQKAPWNNHNVTF